MRLQAAKWLANTGLHGPKSRCTASQIGKSARLCASTHLKLLYADFPLGHRLKLGHKAMRMQYICRIPILSAVHAIVKDETLSIRTSSEIKQLVRMAAERERSSVSSMIEILVLDYARQHKLQPDQKQPALSDRRPIVSIKKEKNVDPNN